MSYRSGRRRRCLEVKPLIEASKLVKYLRQHISLISQSEYLCERRYGFTIWSKPTKLARLLQSVLPLMNLNSDGLAQACWFGWVLRGKKRLKRHQHQRHQFNKSTHSCRMKINDALIFREICIINIFCWARDSRHHDANSVWTCSCFIFTFFLITIFFFSLRFAHLFG